MLGSPVHPASLVDPSLHSPALMELVQTKMSRALIEHLVDTVAETVDYALGRPSSSSTRGRTLSRNPEHTKFLTFVTDILTKADIKVPTILVTLVYIDRAKPHIQIALEQWAHERVFLGALILANKYTNDSTLKNVHWALCTGVFGKRDIGRIEREFLDVLNFELAVSEADLLAHHDALLARASPAPYLHPRARAHPRAPRRAASPAHSRWSADSSDVDMRNDNDPDADSASSLDSVSLPRTPESAPPAPLPFPAKAAHPPLELAPNQHLEHPHPHAHGHRRMSSFSNLIRSFPIPHFHSQSAAARPAPAYHPSSALAGPIRA